MSSSTLRVALDGRNLCAPVARGMDRYTIELVKGLVRAGVGVYLIHREGAPLFAPHLDALQCEVVTLRAPKAVLWEDYSVPRWLRSANIDVFHSPAERAPSCFSPCPTVVTIHSVTEPSYADFVRRGLLPGPLSQYVKPSSSGRLYAGYQILRARRAAAVIAPSHFTRDEIVRLLKVDAAKVVTTHLAAAEVFHQPAVPEAQLKARLAEFGICRPFVLYVSGYELHKNVLGALDAVAILRKRRPDLQFVAVGSSDPPDDVLEAVRARGMTLGVDAILLSKLGDELVDLNDGAEVYLSMSWRESFPLAILEALSRGLPVVASEWGGAPEIVGNGGILIDPRSPSAASDAVDQILRQPRETRRQNAKSAASQFTWTKTVAETIRIYETVVRHKRSVGIGGVNG